jgi:hypothetical protein
MLNLYYIKKDSISKNLIISSFLTPCLKSVYIDVQFLDIVKLNKDLGLRCISLLESITNQKNYCQVRRVILNNKTKQNKFNYCLRVTIRKHIMLNFLKYLNCFLFSEFKRTFYFSTKRINSLTYSYKFLIKNVMLIRVLKSNFLQWFLPVHITLNFSNEFVRFLFDNQQN